MKSEDLKNSNELEKSEKAELENSENSIDSKESVSDDLSSKEKEEKTEPEKVNDEKLPEKPEKEEKISEKNEDDIDAIEVKETVEEKTEAPKAETKKAETIESVEPKEEDSEKEIVEEKPESKETEAKEEMVSEQKDAETEVVETKETEEEKTEAPKAESKKTVTTEPIEAKEEESEKETVKPVAKEVEAKEEKKEEAAAQDKKNTESKKEVESSDETKKTEAKETEKKEKIIVSKKEQLPAEEEKIDYSKYNQVELVNAMRDLIDNAEGKDIKYEIDIIKSVFYKKKNEQIDEQRTEFVKNGGDEKDFVVEENPYENDIKDLLKKFGYIRKEQNKQLDVEKEENLKLKFEIIEKIKALINNEESINKTFNEFRDLQHDWREIGLVPQSKMKNLWDTYHFHVENFYDYIKINRELRDLDLKKNLEAKIALCENAEELMVEPSVLKAFSTLQKYHERWREIGPVPRENKDELWERFKRITSIINKKHQEFFEEKKEEQKKNLVAKTALCEKVEEICDIEIEGYRDWDVKSKELVELQKVWRTIGFAPKKENNKIYDRFRTACDTFFNRKREFYSKNKEIQQNNLQQKLDLCMQAEELKDSTDWKKTTQDFISIQKKWKEIGPVPRKHSDSVWKRFRGACDYFFDKKSEHFSDVDSAQIDNLKLKEGLITELQNFKSSDDVNENLKLLKDIQRRWSEIGHVPFKKKDALQQKFREEIGKLFDQLNINEDKRNMLKFKTKMSTFSESSRGQNKMRFERDKYMSKLKQLENDLILLDNNIGFFAKSKNAEALIEDVKKKIEDTRNRIESLKEKIRVIDDMED